MAVDQEDKQYTPDADKNDPEQQHYDREFAGATDPKGNYGETGTPGDLGQAERQPNGPSKGTSDGSKFPSPQEILAAEGAATAASDRATGAGVIDKVGKGFSANDPRSRIIKAVMGSRKRNVTVGGGLGVTLAIVLILSVLSGPAQIIQVGHILHISDSKNEHDSSDRIGKLFRYYRALKARDIAETRIGKLGSVVMGNTIKQLKDIGIEIERGPSGAPTRTTVDVDKLKGSLPELDGMSSKEIKSLLAKKSGVSEANITRSGNNYTIDQKTADIKATRLFSKSTLSLLDDGRIEAALRARVMAKFFNAPSLFHPLQRALANKENRLLNRPQQAQEEKKAEEKREKALRAPVEAQADEAVARVKNSRFKSTAANVLLFTAGACFVKDVAGEINTINRARKVLPAAVEAVDRKAVGSQAQLGQDASLSQLGPIANSHKDSNGDSIFGGKAFLYLRDGNTKQGGIDLPEDQRQAFMGSKTADEMKKWSSDALGGGLSASAACSRVGIAVQIAASLFLAASTALAEAGTGGAITPGVVALWTARAGASFAATAVAMHYVQGFILNETTEAKLTQEAFSGPVGGNLLAYGSREGSNIVGIASGGIDLGNPTSTIVYADQKQAETQQFKEESFFARMFDTRDYRSLVSRLAVSFSPSFTQNLTSFVKSSANIGTSLASIFASFLPRAAAASTDTYDWGFSQYGIPDSMLNDPSLADPYDNAASAALLLSSGVGNYKQRAMDCFGVNINNDAGDWDVQQEVMVDPISDSYKGAHCNDISDMNWQRIIMFVFDTITMKATACYENDDQSCTDLGAQNTSAAASSDGSVGVSADGFVFPQRTTQSTIKNHNPPWCYDDKTFCHHDYAAADIYADTGTVVLAARGGTVVRAADDGSIFGSRVTIKGEDGNLYYYAHMGDGTLKVKEGQKVNAGDELGQVGTNADAANTDSHLHFDILPSSYSSRPDCSSAGCTAYPFIDPQPVLIEAFKALQP